MQRRQMSKFIKGLLILLVYLIVYLIVSVLTSPNPIYNFVSDEFRVGDKYVLIYLMAKGPILSDVEGAEVFRYRKCGNCFITNNKGFLPVDEYDAVVMHGDRSLMESASMDPGKRYLLQTHRRCLTKKLIGCAEEPRFISFETRDHLDFCELCRHLHEKRKKQADLKRKMKG